MLANLPTTNTALPHIFAVLPSQNLGTAQTGMAYNAQTAPRQSNRDVDKLVRRAYEQRAEVERLKYQLQEALGLAKLDPQSNLYRTTVSDLLMAYATAYAELRHDIAVVVGQGGRSVNADIIELSKPITPLPTQSAAQWQQAQKQQQFDQAQMAAQQTMAAANANAAPGMGGYLAKPALMVATANIGVLLAAAQNPNSTALDGEMLLAAVEQSRDAHRQARIEFRDQRLAALQAQGYTEVTARAMVADEFRADRRANKPQNEQRLRQQCVACRLATGLIAGTVQIAREILPQALTRHADGKRQKKASEMVRAYWREKIQRGTANPQQAAERLAAAKDEHRVAAIRMTMGIRDQLAMQYQAEGYAPRQAKLKALQDFRRAHEERIGMSIDDKKRWRAQTVDGNLTELPIDNAMTPEMVEYRQRVNNNIRDKQLVQAVQQAPEKFTPRMILQVAGTPRQHAATPRAPPGDDGQHRRGVDESTARRAAVTLFVGNQR